MTIFSCRAECQHDLDCFIEAAKSASVDMVVRSFPDKAFPDVDIEITTEATKETLRNLMKAADDAHTMRQTLREGPVASNSMERDFRVK